MKIGDKVKTTPLFAKEFAEEFTGVITKIDTLPQKIHTSDGFATDKNHPTKTYTVATVKTDAGDVRRIDIPWLMTVE